jgi:hypothetical protein
MLGHTRAHPRHSSRCNCRALSALNRTIAFIALATACGLLPASATRAVQVNVISPGFPLVSDALGNFAVNYTVNASASAGFASNAQVQSTNDSQTFYPVGGQLVRNQLQKVTATATAADNFGNKASSYASESGYIGAGKIGGYIDVNVTTGSANARTSLTLTYIDKIHMTSDCDLEITPTVTGSGQRFFNPFAPAEYAVTGAQLDTYFFTAGIRPPAAGVAFGPAYHSRAQVDSVGQTLSVDQSTFHFTAGSDWWFALVFTLSGGANLDYQTDFTNYIGDVYTAVGDFQHTAFTTLDDPNNGSVYTSASGIDYTTAALVPEPISFALASITTAALLRRRPRKA